MVQDRHVVESSHDRHLCCLSLVIGEGGAALAQPTTKGSAPFGESGHTESVGPVVEQERW
jgi:hypothetical protein